jgi:hypothetical protein
VLMSVRSRDALRKIAAVARQQSCTDNRHHTASIFTPPRMAGPAATNTGWENPVTPQPRAARGDRHAQGAGAHAEKHRGESQLLAQRWPCAADFAVPILVSAPRACRYEGRRTARIGRLLLGRKQAPSAEP